MAPLAPNSGIAKGMRQRGMISLNAPRLAQWKASRFGRYGSETKNAAGGLESQHAIVFSQFDSFLPTVKAGPVRPLERKRSTNAIGMRGEPFPTSPHLIM